MRRMFIDLVAVGVLAGLGVLAVAAPASAHAVLVSSSPADGAVVARAPARVSATFDEPVGIIAGSLRVYAPNGNRADSGAVTHGGRAQEITVALKPALGKGTYTVSWHVISADSHPVQGAYTFSIGAPSRTSVTPAGVVRKPGPLVGVVFWLVRWLAYCCFALMVGAVTFLIWCWPTGAGRPQVLRLIIGAWGGLAVLVLAAVLLEGVYGAGQGVSRVFWPNVLHTTLDSRYGRAVGMRLLLVIIALFAISITLESLTAGRRSRVTAGAVWGVLTAAFAATWAVADHSGAGSQVPLAMPADIVHLSAAAVWLGGLTMLAAIVLRRPGHPAGPARGAARSRGQAARSRSHMATAEAARAVTRFSPIALSCVIALIITGTYQAWRNVGTWGALPGTAYGRLLLLKITGLCMLVALGYLARRRIAEGLRDTGAEGTAVTVTASRAEAVTAVFSGAIGFRSAVASVLSGAGHRGGAGSAAGSALPGGGGRSAVTFQPLTGKAGNSAWPVNGNGSAGTPRGHNGSGPAAGQGNGVSLDRDLASVSLARLRVSVTVEAVIAIAVLAATAVLVNTPTARETYARPAAAAASAAPASAAVAFNTGGPGGRGKVSVTVTPARLGLNRVRLSITGTAGGHYRPRQVQAALSLPARNLGPLTVPLRSDGPGHYVSGPVTLTLGGQWRLLVTVRSDAFDETTVTVPVPVH